MALRAVQTSKSKVKSQWVNGRLRQPKNIQELREAFASITSTTAGDVRFMAQATMFLAELREQNATPAPKPKSKRKPTEWQRFFAAGMKAGKSPAQIGEEWRARKD